MFSAARSAFRLQLVESLGSSAPQHNIPVAKNNLDPLFQMVGGSFIIDYGFKIYGLLNSDESFWDALYLR